jgi:hypothetical protein
MLAVKDYGPLTQLVGLVACASSAAWAILASFRGRAKWEPSQEPLPKGPRKVAGAGTALFVVIIWVLFNSPNDIHILIPLGIVSFCLCLLFLLFYRFLIPVYTYTKVVDVSPDNEKEIKILGGLWRKKEAIEEQAKERVTTQQYLKGVGYDEECIWSRTSRELTNTLFAIAYIALTIFGGIALTCGGMLLYIRGLSH